MNKKFISVLSVVIILVFIGYMVFDTIHPSGIEKNEVKSLAFDSPAEQWKIAGDFAVKEGALKAVAVSAKGNIILGGDSFLSCYTQDFKLLWNIKTPYPVTAVSSYGDSIFASTMELVLVVDSKGKIEEEWGPFEDKAIFTSLASNSSYVVLADAGNKIVIVLDKKGRVVTLIGQNDGQFVIPSPYFDVDIDSANTLFVANTGHRRVEARSVTGQFKSYFGEPGMAPGAFCGCCNPAHFIVIPEGFVTAEKGINRIKILNKKGEFVEYVSSKNKFTPSVPLDLASADGKTIYAANPADSKVYSFVRK